MARIVSGLQEQQDPNFALMQGLEMGRAIRQSRMDEEQSRRANEGIELERMRLQFSIQQALQEQMKAEAAVQEQAKAGKLQQFAQRAQAGQVNPGQKMVERIIGARGRLKDPKAVAMFDDSVASLLKSQQQAKKRKAFDETLRMAEMDTDVFPPEMVQGFRQQAEAGGDLDSLIKQANEHRLKTAAQQRVSAENEGLFSQAEAMIQAAPPGEGKKMAETLLYAARQPSQLQIEGKGSEVLRSIQEALLPPKSKWGDAQGDPFSDPDERDKAIRALEDMEEPVTEQAIRARIGRKYGQRPQPTPQEEQIGKTRREAADKPYFLERRNAGIGRVVSQAVQGGARGAEIVKLLRDQGLDPGDPAVLAEIEKAVGGGQ